jgi:tetratricopeptide (TPR) repeat protein
VALQLYTSNALLWPRNPSGLVEREDLGPFFRQLADRPPALPLLAVRAARRAVAANPLDKVAWLSLGQAYKALRDQTCERSAQGRLPPLAQLRQVQIITALEQAVRLDPDLEPAHRALAQLYGEQNALDQALVHLREEFRLGRRAGARPGETAEESAHRLELLERDVVKVEEMVDQRRQVFAARARTLQGQRAAEASAAAGIGLARQAVDDILLPSPADLLGRDGIKLELTLLVSLGEAEKVRSILNAVAADAGRDWLPSFDLPAPPGPDGAPLYPVPYVWPGYGWLRVLEAGALGDYAQARGALRDMRGGLRAGDERRKQELQNLASASLVLFPSLLSGPMAYLPAALSTRILGPMGQKRAALEQGQRFLLTQQADLCVLEGLLALEQGATEDARSAFLEARRLCARPGGASYPFAGGPIADAYLRQLTVKDGPGGR